MANQATYYHYHAIFSSGAPCIVSVRTDFAANAPLNGLPVLCSVVFGYQGDTASGLPNSDDARKLEKIAGQISEHAAQKRSGLWVGSLTSGHRRVEFFYTADADLFHKSNAAYLNSLPEIDFQIAGNAEEDAKWLFYRNSLLPSRKIQAYERNQGTIDAMIAHGDNLEQLRPIHHYIYFDSLENAQAYTQAVSRLGNYLSDIIQSAGHTEAYQVKLTHIGSIHADKLAQTAADLEELAEQFQGQYDDWEALLARQAGS